MPKQRYPNQVLSELSESRFFHPENRSQDTPQEDLETTLPPEIGQAPATNTVVEDDASRHASRLALTQEEMIQRIRKTLRRTGKEVSFVRLTEAEKTQLKEIVYKYNLEGRRTSETEINRIAVNYMLEDYKLFGESSILARVLAALLE